MSYPGGKEGAGVYQAIINQMPPHDHYVEPFAGGAAVLRHKRPALTSIAIDVDYTVTAPLLGLMGTLPGLKVETTEAIAWLAARSTWKHNTLVYCDPPYLLRMRVKKKIYAHELSDEDHARLIRVLRGLPCMVMLSGYWSELYAAALKDWRMVTFAGISRGGPITERLWCNFPAPTALHDVRYVGTDYRERERIKRKAKRWRTNYAALPPLERQVILSELLAAPAGNAAGLGDMDVVTLGQAPKRAPFLPGFAA